MTPTRATADYLRLAEQAAHWCQKFVERGEWTLAQREADMAAHYWRKVQWTS